MKLKSSGAGAHREWILRMAKMVEIEEMESENRYEPTMEGELHDPGRTSMVLLEFVLISFLKTSQK